MFLNKRTEMHKISKDLESVCGSNNTDKGVHGFTYVYDYHFHNRKNEELKILEIGVGAAQGALRMFSKYFPKAHLYGIEFVPEYCIEIPESRIKVFEGNQNDVQRLNSIINSIGDMDIIIDDGGHYMSQQITSLETLYSHVKPGGVYVIEDLFSSYEPLWWDQELKTIDYLKELMDCLIERRKKSVTGFKKYFQENTYAMHFYYELCLIFKKESV